MYFQKLIVWQDADWDLFFTNNNVHDYDREKVKQILTMPKKEGVEAGFDFLREVGIINGIGPSWFGNFFRLIVSWLFKGVKFQFHDICYAIGGNGKDRKKADDGLLKYSKISILRNVIQMSNTEFAGPIKIFLTGVVITLSLFQLLIAYICYSLVRGFGFLAFRYL